MNRPKVFVDSDVVISSLISTKGAAYLLLNDQESDFIISDLSKVELERVVNKMNLNHDRLHDLIKKNLKIIKLTTGLEKIKKDFHNYTSDVDDAHIVAGAAKAKVRFLLTYNLKHFQRQKIKEDFGIVVLTPAQYLQYLRAQD